MNYRMALLIGQIYAHAMFFYGLYHLRSPDLIWIIILNQIVFVGFCGTAFYHRVVAHKHSIHPMFEKLMVLLSWLGISGSAIAWAGTHRQHHRYSDTVKDPHSPKHIGALRAYWLSSGDENIMRYVTDLLRKPIYIFQHQYYYFVLIGLHLIGILFMPFKLYWAFLITPAFLMWFAGSTVNVFCHNQIGPINLNILGYFHAGEGFHKNHHEDSSNKSFRHKADWGQYCLKIMNMDLKWNKN